MTPELSQRGHRSGLAQLFSDLAQRTAPIATAAAATLDGCGSTLADRAASIYGRAAADWSFPVRVAAPQRSLG